MKSKLILTLTILNLLPITSMAKDFFYGGENLSAIEGTPTLTNFDDCSEPKNRIFFLDIDSYNYAKVNGCHAKPENSYILFLPYSHKGYYKDVNAYYYEPSMTRMTGEIISSFHPDTRTVIVTTEQSSDLYKKQIDLLKGYFSNVVINNIKKAKDHYLFLKKNDFRWTLYIYLPEHGLFDKRFLEFLTYNILKNSSTLILDTGPFVKVDRIPFRHDFSVKRRLDDAKKFLSGQLLYEDSIVSNTEIIDKFREATKKFDPSIAGSYFFPRTPK